MDDHLAQPRPTPPAPPDAATAAAQPGVAASDVTAGRPEGRPPAGGTAVPQEVLLGASEPVPLESGSAPEAAGGPGPTGPGPMVMADGPGPSAGGSGATASQLRRFIKSRPWVPMHELRRRFGIEGPEDEMAPMDVPDGRVFVGLPAREAGLLADLIRQGDVGYELVHDPDCPAVAGVYPMRPVVRS